MSVRQLLIGTCCIAIGLASLKAENGFVSNWGLYEIATAISWIVMRGFFKRPYPFRDALLAGAGIVLVVYVIAFGVIAYHQDPYHTRTRPNVKRDLEAAQKLGE